MPAKRAQPVRSPVLEKFIPVTARSSDDLWFALTYRARVAYVSRDRVRQDSLSYGALAGQEFGRRICMRSGQHPYNNALFASQLAHLGEPAFRTWLTGLKKNLSEKPSGNDRAQSGAFMPDLAMSQWQHLLYGQNANQQ